MNLNELVKKLLKKDETRWQGEWILDIARLNDDDSRMYLDVFKEEEGTRQEYEFLHMLAQGGILSEKPIVSERGGKYSLFKITERGKHYFREHKLRTD